MAITILIILLTILALTVGGGLFILMAYGIGWATDYFTGFGLFSSTALGLAAIFVFIMFLERVVKVFTSTPPSRYESIDEDYDDDEEDDDELDDYEIIKDVTALNKLYSRIPPWRRPTKIMDFSNTAPDDRCPCGSRRKYKNCHGAKQKKI